MKSKQEKKDDKESIRNNSMTLKGKSPLPQNKKRKEPEEFEETRSINLRTKSEPLAESAKKKK